MTEHADDAAVIEQIRQRHWRQGAALAPGRYRQIWRRWGSLMTRTAAWRRLYYFPTTAILSITI